MPQVTGRRVYPDSEWRISFGPGDYGNGSDGIWRARAPGEESSMGSLENHTVLEHEDGTISVTPSIQLEPTATLVGWHGHLTKGVWSW